MDSAGTNSGQDYETVKASILVSLESCSDNLFKAMVASFIHLLFPVNFFLERFFTSKTNRKAPEIGLQEGNEALLFSVVVVWIKDWWEMSGSYSDDLIYGDPSMTPGQLQICNLITHNIR